MDYIELKSDGDRVLVNLAQIAFVTATTDGCVVTLNDGGTLDIDESYIAVRNRINNATPDFGLAVAEEG